MILSFIFLNLNLKFGSFLNHLREYRKRDDTEGFPELISMQLNM